MYKAVIFDFGNTLVRYVPSDIVRALGAKVEDVPLLAEALFDRKYWDALDDGTLSQAEFCERAVEAVPERLKDIALQICNGWHTVLPVIDGMGELVCRLKADGYKLYLLSNIGEIFIKEYQKIDILRDFDGYVFSSEIKMIKPNRDIFEHLLHKFELVPEECLFVDDLAHNVKGALACGIDAVLFDGNVQRVIEKIYGE